jgi:hypothetical protein
VGIKDRESIHEVEKWSGRRVRPYLRLMREWKVREEREAIPGVDMEVVEEGGHTLG